MATDEDYNSEFLYSAQCVRVAKNNLVGCGTILTPIVKGKKGNSIIESCIFQLYQSKEICEFISMLNKACCPVERDILLVNSSIENLTEVQKLIETWISQIPQTQN